MTLMAKPYYIESMAGGVTKVMVGLDILAAAALGAEGSGNEPATRDGIADQIPGFIFKRTVFPNSLLVCGDLLRMRGSPLGGAKSGFLSGPSMIFLHCLLSVFLVLVLPFFLVLLNEFGMLRNPSLVVLEGLLFVSVVIFPLLFSASLFVGQIPFALPFLGACFLKERIDFTHFETLQMESKMSTVIWEELL